MDVASILEHLGAKSQPLGRDEEGIDLIPAGGSVRSDLIVEGELRA